MIKYKPGETLTLTMDLSEPLDGNSMKFGIYSPGELPVFETSYPDGGRIQQVDATHYGLQLTRQDTLKFFGTLTMRMAVFSPDMTLVAAADEPVVTEWEPDPVLRNI